MTAEKSIALYLFLGGLALVARKTFLKRPGM